MAAKLHVFPGGKTTEPPKEPTDVERLLAAARPLAVLDPDGLLALVILAEMALQKLTPGVRQ